MRVNCSRRGIVELNLSNVFPTHEEHVALTTVKHLILSHNLLREVTSLSSLSFRTLHTLDVSYNQIERMEGLPTTLVILHAAHNKLRGGFEWARGLTSLQELDVSNNLLSSVRGLPQHGSLRVLKASCNKIHSLHGIELCRQTLHSFDISHNILATLDELDVVIMEFPKLEELCIEGNPFVDGGQTNMEEYFMRTRTQHHRSSSSVLKIDVCHPTSNAIHPPPPPSQQRTMNSKVSTPRSPASMVSTNTTTTTTMTSNNNNQNNNNNVFDAWCGQSGVVMEQPQQPQQPQPQPQPHHPQVRALEIELREVRKALADQLNLMSVVKLENDELRMESASHKKETEHLQHEIAMLRETLRKERLQYHDDSARLRAQNIILQKDNMILKDELSRIHSHHHHHHRFDDEDERRYHPPPPPQRQQHQQQYHDPHHHHDEQVHIDDDPLDTFAYQMKEWLLQEINHNTTTTNTTYSTTSQQHQPTSRHNHLSNTNNESLWKRNESLLYPTGRHAPHRGPNTSTMSSSSSMYISPPRQQRGKY